MCRCDLKNVTFPQAEREGGPGLLSGPLTGGDGAGLEWVLEMQTQEPQDL